MLDHVLFGTRHRVEFEDAVDLIPKELHPDGQIAHIGQVDIHRVAVDAEFVADKVDVVPLILQVDQPPAELVPLQLHAGAEADDHAAVVDGVAQRVDAGHRRHNDDIPPLRKCRRGRVAQAVDLVVDGAVFLDIGIRAGDIGLRLVVVVVGDKILHRVFREKRAELGAQLGRQCFVVGQHQRGAVAFCNDVGHGKGLAASGNAQQGLAAVSPLHALHQPRDGLGLIPRGLIIGHQLKRLLCHGPLSSLKPQLVVFFSVIIPQLFYKVNHLFSKDGASARSQNHKTADGPPPAWKNILFPSGSDDPAAGS